MTFVKASFGYKAELLPEPQEEQGPDMALREIVRIDEEKCDGCGDCVPSCAEGAIQVIDGKARLVADVYCDGLGACLGDCPEGALQVIERDAEAFDEELVAEHGVSLSMDVYNGTYTENVGRDEGYPEHIMQRNFDTTEAQRVVFEKAYARGIAITYGTDAAVLPHDMGGWQFGIMVERGMKPMDAMRSAMSVAARHMGWEDRVGAIKPGLYGDLIAVRGDPLEDQGVMKDVEVVIKGGLAFKLPAGQ